MIPGDTSSRIMAAIAALPPEEQPDAIYTILSEMMKHMPKAAILEMRGEIVAQFEPGIPIIETTLEVIYGHLALREIQGK